MVAEAGQAATRPALIIPVLDAGDGPQGANAGTPYLGGYNDYQIPRASGNSRATAGYYSIALQDSTRLQPTVIATQVLTGPPSMMSMLLPCSCNDCIWSKHSACGTCQHVKDAFYQALQIYSWDLQ